MAKVRSNFDEVRWVPWLDRQVDPGETVEVPDDELESWLAGGWQPADRATKAAAKQLAEPDAESEPTKKPTDEHEDAGSATEGER